MQDMIMMYIRSMRYVPLVVSTVADTSQYGFDKSLFLLKGFDWPRPDLNGDMTDPIK